MNSICSVKTALRAFAASKHWNSTVKENDMAIAKAAVALANSNEFSTISSCAEMAENSTAMSVLAASETAMSVLADSATARTALTGSSYYGKYMQNDTMCIAKLAVGFANPGLLQYGWSSRRSNSSNTVAASNTAIRPQSLQAAPIHERSRCEQHSHERSRCEQHSHERSRCFYNGNGCALCEKEKYEWRQCNQIGEIYYS